MQNHQVVGVGFEACHQNLLSVAERSIKRPNHLTILQRDSNFRHIPITAWLNRIPLQPRLISSELAIYFREPALRVRDGQTQLATAPVAVIPMGRSYQQADIKLLFGLSACKCAFPGCKIICTEPETQSDSKLVYAEICHICAFKDNGPRSDRDLSPQERNRYPNLILLCPNHHQIVDAQPNTYDAATLRTWKASCEQQVHALLAEGMLNVTFEELNSATSSLLAPSDQGMHHQGPVSLALTPIERKISKNGLTTQSKATITMSLVAAGSARSYIEKMSITNPGFAEKLRERFATEYNELADAGLAGDSLFAGMLDFATQRCTAFGDKAAAIALLIFFFESCDIFQP